MAGLMAAVHTFHAAGDPIASLTWADDPPDGIGGRLYGPSGVEIDATGVTLSVVSGAPDLGRVNGLPDAAAHAITYLVNGFGQVAYYSAAPASRAYPYRVVPHRVPSDAVAVEVELLKDGEVSAAVLTVTENPSGGDYVYRGWDVTEPGDFEFSAAVPAFTLATLRWSVGAAAALSSIPLTRWDLSAQALIGHFSESIRVKIWRRTAHPNPPALAIEDVPATMPSMSDETRALSGAVAQIYFARADLKGNVLDGASTIELPGGKKYPFDLDLTAGGRLAQGSMHDSSVYVSGFLRAGAA